MTGETVDRKEVLKQAFVKALPITGSYLFVSMAYGLTMQEAGLPWFWSLFTSLTVYTGAFQFVLVTFLSSGASILTIALTALFMNSRQFFYGLTFVEDFKKMGKRYPYMVHTMTDETYAVNCSMLSSEVIRDRNAEKANDRKRRFDIMFYVALFSRVSWMVGAVLGGILGQILPGNRFLYDSVIYYDRDRSMEKCESAFAGACRVYRRCALAAVNRKRLFPSSNFDSGIRPVTDL